MENTRPEIDSNSLDPQARDSSKNWKKIRRGYEIERWRVSPCRAPAAPNGWLTPRSERSRPSPRIVDAGSRLDDWNDGGREARAVVGRGSRGWPCWLPESRTVGVT